MCKCVRRNAVTHSQICDEIPPLGREDASQPLYRMPMRNLQNAHAENGPVSTRLKPDSGRCDLPFIIYRKMGNGERGESGKFPKGGGYVKWKSAKYNDVAWGESEPDARPGDPEMFRRAHYGRR